jgi:hypothetical protein
MWPAGIVYRGLTRRLTMMQHRNARLGLWGASAGVLALASFCFSRLGITAEPPTGKVQQGLIGGTEVNEREQERLGLLTMQDPAGGGFCSASLLRNDWAITAAHCVETEDAAGDPMPDPNRPGQNQLTPAGRIKLKANWGGQIQTAVRIETFRPYDVAIIQLFDPIKVNNRSVGFVRQIFQGNRKGIEIRTYGRGLSKFAYGEGDSAVPSESDGKYRVATATITTEYRRTFAYKINGGASTAGGDSGGPSLTGNDELVGVGSTAKAEYVPGKPKRWKWATGTSNDQDASVAPVWRQIAKIMGPVTPNTTSEPEPPKAPVFTYTVPFDTKTSSDFHILYGVKEDGTLIWHRHLISRSGNSFKHSWNPTKKVGDGWLVGYKNAYPAGMNGIYSLADDGTLRWYWHTGVLDGSYRWREPSQIVGTGWTMFTQIIPMDKGVVYGILPNGDLRWQRHLNYQTGVGGTGSQAWANARIVGWGWNGFKTIFGGGNGVLYVVTSDGKLMWYRHKEYLNPPAAPASSDSNAVKLKWERSWEQPKKVGDGWGEFTKLFSPGEGHIYGILPNGDLMYYRHLGWANGTYVWDENAKGKIASGWDSYVRAFARNDTSDAGSGNPEVDIVVH